MPLSVGDKIGPYEVLSLLGQGGMGEVYRARDSKLKRDVALKVLPEAFTGDPERMARFEREAQLLASLNHPNIAHLYGLEGPALVMELVEGESPKGPMPFDEAWKIVSQIADALEYAHERGVIHRDLKPANARVTPEGVVKLLDFGLAKAFSPQAPAAGDQQNSPTLTMNATQVGVILGTAGYMAPEQARGKSVDKRADIWAFGVVLYELLTGERLFKGDDVSETLAHVLTTQPDLSRAPMETRRLLKECLVKDPKHRLRDIGDAKRLLGSETIVQAGSAPFLSHAGKLGWITAAVLAAASAAGLWWFKPAPAVLPLMNLSVDLGPDADLGDVGRSRLLVSPDGASLVFLSHADGKQQLSLRRLAEPKSTVLPGTENATYPFFSPDGRWIAFGADGKLKKIPVQGGAAVTLCDAPILRGGSWGRDGNIILGTSRGGLTQVSESGGTPKSLTQLDPQKGEVGHRAPQILPGGGAVLFTAVRNNFVANGSTIDVQSLKTGTRTTLQSNGYYGRYLPTSNGSGHLLYMQQGTLFATAMDPDKLVLTGPAAPMVEDVATGYSNVAAQFVFSLNGIFAYVSRQVTDTPSSIAWLDRTGKTQPVKATPGFYRTPRISPDGKRLALAVRASAASPDSAIWIYDFQRDTMSKVSDTAGVNDEPVWTPDSRGIVYRSAPEGGFGLYWLRADGGAAAVRLTESKNSRIPTSFSPDGKTLVYYEPGPIAVTFALPVDWSVPEHPKAGQAGGFPRHYGVEILSAPLARRALDRVLFGGTGRYRHFRAAVSLQPSRRPMASLKRWRASCHLVAESPGIVFSRTRRHPHGS